jgi:hypothetical protein
MLEAQNRTICTDVHATKPVSYYKGIILYIVEGDTARGTTTLVYLQLHISLYRES